MKGTSNIKKPVDPSELICIADLMLRWPHDTAVKICHEMSRNKISLYIISDIATRTGSSKLIIVKSVFEHLNHKYLCDNISRLVFLRKDIERSEAKNELYRMDIQSLTNTTDSYECTLETISRLAPQILYAIYRHSTRDMISGRYYPDNVVAFSFRAEKIISPDMCLDGPRDKWRINSDKLRPNLFIATKRSNDIYKNDSMIGFIQKNRLLGVKDLPLLAKLVDQEYPGLTDKQLGILLPAKEGETPKYHAARKQGQRLRQRYIKKYGPIET